MTCVGQTVELYYPNENFDFRTIGQLAFSVFSTVVLIVASLWVCFPGALGEGKGGRRVRAKVGVGISYIYLILCMIL